MKPLIAILSLVLLSGCSPASKQSTGPAATTNQPAPAESSVREVSSVRDVVETMSQYNKIEDGRKASQKIRNISAEHKRDLGDVEAQ